ncbi:hypothetical protein [Lysobacter humi (ex Lee et al. 2017)]
MTDTESAGRRKRPHKYDPYPNLLDGRIGDAAARIERQETYEEYLHLFGEDPWENPECIALMEEDKRLFWASILKVFVDAVNSGRTPPKSILRYLSLPLGQVLAGWPWELAIRLPERDTDPRRLPQSEREMRDRLISELVSRKRFLFRHRRNAAIEDVADEFHVSVKATEAAYDKYRDRALESKLIAIRTPPRSEPDDPKGGTT